MNVTQCDVCGNVAKHEQSVYVKVNKVTCNGKVDELITAKDLCPACWDKLNKLLTKNGSKT